MPSVLRARHAGTRWLSAALVCAAVACHSQPRPPHPERWAKAWIDSLNSHRVEQVAPMLGETGTYQDPFSDRPRAGMTALLAFIAQWRLYPSLHYDVRRVTGDAHVVVVEWEASGYGALSQRVPLPGVFVLELQDDALVRVRAYHSVFAAS